MKILKKSMHILGCVLLIATASSCTTFRLSGIQLTKEIPSYQTVGQFEIKVPVMEFLGRSGGSNFLNVTATAMDTKIYDAIQREVQKMTGDAAVNVTVRYKVSFVGAIINALTFTILAPAVAEVSGSIVKYTN